MSDFKANMHQIGFRLGLRPRPRWRSLQLSPDPIAAFKGPTSKGRGGMTGEGKGREGKGGQGERRGGERSTQMLEPGPPVTLLRYCILFIAVRFF